MSASIDLKLLRFIILGATHCITQWYDSKGARRPDEIAQIYVDVILNGAAARG